jgi:hypothetical protein
VIEAVASLSKGLGRDIGPAEKFDPDAGYCSSDHIQIVWVWRDEKKKRQEVKAADAVSHRNKYCRSQRGGNPGDPTGTHGRQRSYH